MTSDPTHQARLPLEVYTTASLIAWATQKRDSGQEQRLGFLHERGGGLPPTVAVYR